MKVKVTGKSGKALLGALYGRVAQLRTQTAAAKFFDHTFKVLAADSESGLNAAMEADRQLDVALNALTEARDALQLAARLQAAAERVDAMSGETGAGERLYVRGLAALGELPRE